MFHPFVVAFQSQIVWACSPCVLDPSATAPIVFAGQHLHHLHLYLPLLVFADTSICESRKMNAPMTK
jgi:hypothetical protein